MPHRKGERHAELTVNLSQTLKMDVSQDGKKVRFSLYYELGKGRGRSLILFPMKTKKARRMAKWILKNTKEAE